MIPWETLDRARTPDGLDLVLLRRAEEFVIRAAGRDLMSSVAHGSEEALATLACARLAALDQARILVGGLGLGYTTRAVLDALPPTAEVVVAEIVAAVVEWNRGPLGHLANHPLDDPRLRVEIADVSDLLTRTTVRFDAILLDVDNGPQALTRRANHCLYVETGLVTARRALRRGGLLAVWSAFPDDAFAHRLGRAGFTVETHRVRARGASGGARHHIFLGLAPR